ncbi:helix-turn-helix domain-containing protein [Companilactobacillus paralimentarius]|uniref:helix-turn-helix domain-containing protein n=1 Tax=Companilactobacillus paralimentarius TaxID=83526 RepID=UPI00384D1E37
MKTRPIEILLSPQQLADVELQVYQTVMSGISKANEAKVQKNWMKSSDLADYLPISDSTIREHLSDLPFHIIGGTKFYNKKEVDDYLLNK